MKTITTLALFFICFASFATDKAPADQLADLRTQLRNAQFVAGYIAHPDNASLSGNVYVEKKGIAMAKTFYGGSLTQAELRTIAAVERCKEIAKQIKKIEKSI